MYKRPFREKNPRLVFYNTHTHLFERESYSSLVRNHCSLFSIPLHYHTLRGDLYPNTIHTFSECSECFWSCWEALEEAKSRKWHVRSTWLEVEESCQTVVFASVSPVRPSRETVAKHSAWRFFKCDFPTLHPFYIYTLITHKCVWGHSERKTLDRFFTTHTSIF